MKRKTTCKKSYSIAVFALIAVCLIIFGIPYGGASVWNKVFSFLGLNDFSACADSSPMSVHVLDVGKADSIFIECGGKYMLVDGGTADRGADVAAYLRRRGVKKLEYVVNTHPDEDHVGGLKYVINGFSVEHYFAPDIPKKLVPSSDAYIDTQAALKNKNIITVSPSCGDTFTINNLKIQVLGPVKQAETTNNNSIILKLTYGDVRFLLMGDAEKEEEDDLIASGENLSADVLKAGHHGSGTSSTQQLLSAVNPKYAAISVGYDRNKLPNKNVLKRLYNGGISVFRTDVSGTLIFMTYGHNISVKAEK